MKAKIQEKTSLLEALQRLSPDSSKNTLKSWIEHGRVTIDDTAPSSWRQELLPGQELKVGHRHSFADEGIKILYEDEYLAIIDKPTKLLTVASLMESERTAHSILSNRLK